MNNIVRRTVLAAIVIALASAEFAHAEVITNLRSHWKLDETSAGAVVDSAGYSNGTNNGATINQEGKIGKAYSFGGDGDYVDTNTSTVIPASTAFSLFAWFKTSGENGGSIFNNIGNSSQGGRAQFSVHSSDVGRWWHKDGASISTPTTVNDGDWHHLGVTRTVVDPGNDTFTLWLDGVNVDSATVDKVIDSGTHNWLIGVVPSDGSYSFDGPIDDVGVWTRDLSGKEIAAVAGLGDFTGIDLGNGQIDDVLALVAGESAMAGDTRWYYTETFDNLPGGTTLEAGLHYTGTNGEKYIVLEEGGGDYIGVTTIPEPSTLVLLAIAGLGLLLWRLRRKK